MAKPWSYFSNFRCVPRLILLVSVSSKLYKSILFGTSEWKADFCVNPPARPSQQTQNKSSAFQFEDKQMRWDISSLSYKDIKRYINSILLHSHIVHRVPEYISCRVFIWQLCTCMFVSLWIIRETQSLCSVFLVRWEHLFVFFPPWRTDLKLIQ